MAKKIYYSDEDIRNLLESAVEQIKRTKMQSTGATLTLNQTSDNRRATLQFTASAWLKMYSLVQKYSTEVEWHGIVERIDESTFIVKDILLFPHEVSSATVISDQKEYEEWLDSLDDDTFAKCRFHGHSHVNMGVYPSNVDTTYRKNVINNFGTPSENDDYFYIFLITNKRGEVSAEIYDLSQNALYETKDIDIAVVEVADLKDRIRDYLLCAVNEYVEKITPKQLSSLDAKGKIGITVYTDVEIEDDVFLSEFIAESEGYVKTKTPVSTPLCSTGSELSAGTGVTTAHNQKKGGKQLQSKRPDSYTYDYFEDNLDSYYGRGIYR